MVFFSPSLILFFQTVVVVGTNKIPSWFECKEAGKFSVSGSCWWYVECVEEGNGVLLAPILRICPPGTAFSTILSRCLEDAQVKGCNVTMASHGQVHVPEFDHVCWEQPNQYVCANCRTLVNCIDGQAFPTTCHDEEYCNVDKEHFGGGVCYSDIPTQCMCQQGDVFKQDYYDPSTFYVCDQVGYSQMHHCPTGYVFDKRVKECRSRSGLPSCQESGMFAMAEDCSRYYACIITTEGWLQHEFKCPKDKGTTLFYNEGTGTCDNPCLWPEPNFECTEEGRFSDPFDCNSFFVCTWDKDASMYRRLRRMCPEGYEWQQTVGSGTGRCVEMVSPMCTTVTATHCVIPQSLCNSQ